MEGVKFPKKNFFFSLVRRGKRKKKVGFKLAPDYMFPKGGGGGRLPLHIHMIKRKAHGLWDKKPNDVTYVEELFPSGITFQPPH